MTKATHIFPNGRILQGVGTEEGGQSSNKPVGNQQSPASHIIDHHPYPILRIGSNGTLIYSNIEAKKLLQTLSPEDQGLQLYRLSVLVLKAIANKVKHRLQYNIANADYRIEIRPSHESEYADLYFTEISESIKIRNYFEVQSAFAEALLSAENIEDVVWGIVKEAVSRLGYEDCVVYIYDEVSSSLVQKAAHGPKNPRDSTVEKPNTLQLGQGIVGSVAMTRVGEIINDVSTDKRYLVDDESRLSEITVPIVDGDTLLGVIDSEHRHRNFYSPEDLSILSAIASMAATKIQRIKSSDAIKAEQLKNKILIDNAFGGIYTLRGRRFEMVNRVFKEITGYTERELTATQFDMQTLIASIESEGIEAMASREMGDSARKSYQLVIRTKQNEVKRLAINTVILEDEKGPYTLGVALDITPLLSSEKKLKEANEELSSRNEELKHFAHMASHNLRAPVSNMLGLLAIYDANENESTHNQTVITSLNTTVNELNRTLEDMHYVLKMRATDENNFEEINLNEVYSMCCNVLKDQIDGSGIEIKLHFEVPTIKYIRYHLDNIFINMLSNAIKYRKLGSTPHLTVSSTAQDGDIELCFQDNGIGIDLNKYGNELFGMYKRFTQQSTGRGIGLYLVHSQVHAMGGTITVESEIASGTLFKIRLNPGL